MRHKHFFGGFGNGISHVLKSWFRKFKNKQITKGKVLHPEGRTNSNGVKKHFDFAYIQAFCSKFKIWQKKVFLKHFNFDGNSGSV